MNVSSDIYCFTNYNFRFQINGGAADLDGHIMKGDILISVNGQNVENCSGEEAGAILKTVSGKVSLKLHRYKPTTTLR